MKLKDIENWIENKSYSLSDSPSEMSEHKHSKSASNRDLDSSISNRSDRSSNVSFSQLKIDPVFQFLKIGSLDKFIKRQTTFLSNFLEIQSAPLELKELVYSRLRTLVGSHSYPNSETDFEDIPKLYVGSVLSEVLFFINKTIDPSDVDDKYLATNKFQFEFNEEETAEFRKYGDLDREKKPSGEVDMLVKDNNGLIMCIEVKNGTVESGYKQCLLYLKIAYRLNPVKRTVYGVSTNAVHWGFISYACTSFKRLEEQKLLFSLMGRLAFKDYWMNDNSLTVDIIYTILLGNLDADSISKFKDLAKETLKRKLDK